MEEGFEIKLRFLLNLKVDERQRKHAEAKRWFQAQVAANPDLTPNEVRTKIIADRITAAREKAIDDPTRILQTAWINHPFPDLAEPVKRFRYVTDYGD